jgi:hypothetical protein
MLKYCGDELDPKSRALLDYHPIEVARQMALAARRLLCSWQPSELMSRAWMKDAADAHARDCPNIKRIIKPVQPHQPLGGVGNSARHRRRADAPQHEKRFVELAHCCRDVQNVHNMYAVGLNQWAVQRAQGASGRSCRPSGRSATPELDQLCNPKSNSAEMRALLRCEFEVGVAGVWRCAPAQLEQEAPQGRQGALRAPLPAPSRCPASAVQRHRARCYRQADRPRERAAAAQGARSQQSCRVGAREDAAATAATQASEQ